MSKIYTARGSLWPPKRTPRGAAIFGHITPCRRVLSVGPPTLSPPTGPPKKQSTLLYLEISTYISSHLQVRMYVSSHTRAITRAFGTGINWLGRSLPFAMAAQEFATLVNVRTLKYFVLRKPTPATTQTGSLPDYVPRYALWWEQGAQGGIHQTGASMCLSEHVDV